MQYGLGSGNSTTLLMATDTEVLSPDCVQEDSWMLKVRLSQQEPQRQLDFLRDFWFLSLSFSDSIWKPGMQVEHSSKVFHSEK